MKIAICVAGIVRGNVNDNIKRAQDHFGNITKTNIFFATWEEYKNDQSEKLECSYFPEPVLDYNPWLDCDESPHPKYAGYRKRMLAGEKMNKKLPHATKQIIAHAHQLKHQVPKTYDLIVRTRWDTFISEQVDFQRYLDYAYENRCAVGFAIRGNRHPYVHKFKEVPKIYPKEDQHPSVSNDWGWWINDNMIIHHRYIFKPDKVFDLHKEGKLLPAEYGWYQVLSEGRDDLLSVYGGAALERYVRR